MIRNSRYFGSLWQGLQRVIEQNAENFPILEGSSLAGTPETRGFNKKTILKAFLILDSKLWENSCRLKNNSTFIFLPKVLSVLTLHKKVPEAFAVSVSIKLQLIVLLNTHFKIF